MSGPDPYSLRELLRLFRPRQGRLAGLLALIVIAAFAEAVGLVLLSVLLNQLADVGGAAKQPAVLAPVYEYARANPRPFLLLIAATYLGKSALALWVTYSSCTLALVVTDQWRTQLIRGLFGMPIQRLDKQQGALLQLILDEPTNIGFGLSAVGLLAQNALSAAMVYATLLALSPAITVGLTIMAVAAIGTVWLLSRYSRQIAIQRSQAFSDGYVYLAEMLTAIKQLRLFDLEAEAEARAMSHMEKMRRIQRRASFLASSPRLLIEVVFLCGLMLVFLVLAPSFGEASAVPAIGLAVVAALRLLPSFSASAGNWVAIQQAWPPLQRISRELSKMERETADLVVPVARVPVVFRERIRFEEVSFAYPGRSQVFSAVDLEIGWGEFVAVVGASGSGKSTLVDLLCGFYEPDKGQILVDGINLRSISLSHWRRQLGVVAQDAFLLSGTIRENLCLLRPDCPEKVLEEVVALVGADQLIRDLPAGYQTRIGERGFSLSGGQRQRLALARVLVREPRLLVLDEATSSLDVESEEVVQEGLERIRHRLTMVVIAHQLSTVRRADQIYVLDEGRVVEMGSHESLLQQHGLYAAMWRTTKVGLAT